MRVASLHVYPVKGVRAVDQERAHVETRGLGGDRRWLFIDASGAAITQRTHPRLATLTARLSPAGVALSAPGAEPITIAVPKDGPRADVTVWDDAVNAALAADDAHRWAARVFEDDIRLVFMDAAAARAKTGQWTKSPVPVSFADAFPILVTTTGSLAALNETITRHGGAAVPMARFRPNIVIACDDPWREDFWRRLRIGAVEVDLMKPCDRCVVTTKDQETGESMGKEPLASLARLRRSADPRINGVLFGWNAAPVAPGAIAVGDAVDVLEERRDGFPILKG